MNPWRRMQARIRALLHKRKLDADMDEEMRAHLEMRTQHNMDAGMPAEEARYAALRQFGWVESIKETCRDQRGMNWFENLGQDIRYSARMLRKNPGFTAVAVLTLALGIGVNTAAFSVLNTLLLHTVPYPRPDELVRVFRTTPTTQRGVHAPANLADYRAKNTVFEHLAVFQRTSFNLAAPGQPADRLAGLLVTEDFFPSLGVEPALGRSFAPEETRPGGNAVVVLSHAEWVRRFGRDPSVVGREIRIDGGPATIIGVMPAAFADYQLWGDVAAWRPMVVPAFGREDRDNTYLSAIARLKPGISLARAQAQMDVLAAQLAVAYPQFNAGAGLRLASLSDSIYDDTSRGITWLVMGLSGFVLLIACANLANLQFARNLEREREDAIRTALGASRARLMRAVLLESVLLSLAGGVLGCVVAQWSNTLVGRHFLPGAELLRLDIPLDRRVLAFTFAVSVSSGIAFGLLPAWLASRANVNDALKQAGRTLTVGRAPLRLRHALIIGEIALALVLLAGAGFFLRGLQRFAARDPGWRTEHLLTAQVKLSGQNPEKNAAFYEQLQARLAALPGVERVAIASSLPTSGFSNQITFVVEGRPEPDRIQVPTAAAANVTPGFFETLGMRLIEGRDFTIHDREGTARVVIINESMARKLWPGESPLGKRIGGATPHMSNPREIVGVVSDAGAVAVLRDFEGRFQMYRPLAQQSWQHATIALRTRAAPETLARELRRIVAGIDPDHAVYQVSTTKQVIRRSLAAMDAAAWALAGFAMLGLLLAAVGIYGVIAGFVAQRTSEIGIRMALGAQIRDVLHLVLGQSLQLALLGTALGLAGAFAVARLLASIIPALPSAEPTTAAAVALLLVAVAVLACWLPARRAARIDPMVALRHE